MKRVGILLFLGFVFSSILAQPSDKPLTVVLDWYVNPDHAPLLVGEAEGFFQQEGVTVKLITPADPSDGPKLVAAKKMDIAISYQPQLLLHLEQGLPLVRFGVLIGTPLDCIVALKSGKIQRIEDLKGKIIGYSGETDKAMLTVMLQSHGMTLRDVQLINVHYDLLQALLSGRIAAFSGGMRNVEPIELEQLGRPAQVFYPEQHGAPPYEELIFVTHRDVSHDPRLTSFLRGVQKSVDYLIAHPQESWAAVIKKHPELDNPVNKASWLATIPYFSKNPAAALDESRSRRFAEFMQQQGLIEKPPRVTDYAL